MTVFCLKCLYFFFDKLAIKRLFNQKDINLSKKSNNRLLTNKFELILIS